MQMIFLLLLIAAATTCTSAETNSTSTCAKEIERHQEDCENLTTEYEKYRECMQHRVKRSASCNDECNECDCSSCEESCEEDDCADNCCNSCCQTQQRCTTFSCCHRSCRAECRSSSCRSNCRRKCHTHKDSPTSSNGSISGAINQTLRSDHNITTIIHLNNIINNTNLINLPVHVNNTNINNITVEGGTSSGSDRIIVQEIPGIPGMPGRDGAPGISGNVGTVSNLKENNCCLTVGPKQCTRQEKFPYVKCYHVRKHACGAMCTAPVVHYQKHRVCDNEIENQPCKDQTVYIPQQQSRCTYQETYPYITCDPFQEQSPCSGCNYNPDEGANCPSYCMGGYYQPYYRPPPPIPNCMQSGTCGGYPQVDMIDNVIQPDEQGPVGNVPNDPYIQPSIQMKNLLSNNHAEIKIVPMNKEKRESGPIGPTVTTLKYT